MKSLNLLARFLVLLLLISVGSSAVLAEDGPSKAEQQAAVMKEQGWTYVMPRPKSSQARWGNKDGRTTWWLGYWRNSESRKYSRSTPSLDGEGQYTGDGINDSGQWRRGGAPNPKSFSELQLLMSDPKTHPPSRKRSE